MIRGSMISKNKLRDPEKGKGLSGYKYNYFTFMMLYHYHYHLTITSTSLSLDSFLLASSLAFGDEEDAILRFTLALIHCVSSVGGAITALWISLRN